MGTATCIATTLEKRRPLPGDAMVPKPIFASTHAITIDAPPEQVWPWIAQMGAGRAGWYAWDAIDNGGTPSATSIMPAFQTVACGDVLPAIPGATDAFVVAAVDPPRHLVLTVSDGRGGNAVAWEHVLDPLSGGRTRLIVRGRASSHWLDLARATPPTDHRRIFIERVYGWLATLPRPVLIPFAALGHRIMEARHLRGIQRRSTAASIRRDVRGESSRKALLACGIASSLLYALLIWTIRYEGYSLISQVPSELAAIGAPTQRLWALLGPIYTLLVAAFGWGIWRSAGRHRPVHIVGGLVLAFASLGLLWPFAPMHQREVLAAGGGTLSDTMHVALGAVSVLLMFLAIGFGASAFGKRFRLYSIASIIVLLAFGLLTFLDAPRLHTNLPTPWIGLWERINISVFLLWVVVLAAVLWRTGTSKESHVMSSPSPFTSPEGEAKFLATYDAALTLWPVPYQEFDIPTRFGMTHVVVAGPPNAPALVLLHGYMATSVMWAPNIADFSRDYRVYAIDIMGQPGKSVPGDSIRDARDYVAWLTATLDGLHVDRVSLAGMSFGGWLALQFAVAAPDRVQRLVLLSPGGFLPMVKQFGLRGMLMALFPTRFTVNSFMRWAGISEWDARSVLELMYLGAKHFRMPKATMRVNRGAANALSDDELRSLHMPVLLLFGDDEVIYDPARACDRARRLIPHFEGGLIPRCRHDMCLSQSGIVDARVLDFLKKEGRQPPETEQRSVA